MTRTLFAMAALSAAGCAGAAPIVRDEPAGVTVRGTHYELRVSKTAGVFDLLTADASGALVSVMRPGGEKGWFGYNTDDGGGRSTPTVRPTVTVRSHARGATVTAVCVLDATAGVAHTAQYDCLDDSVIVCSRYDGATLPAGLALVRSGPKLDVDVDRLTDTLFFDDKGARHAGTLAGRAREYYAGPRAWTGPDSAAELDPNRPYMLLHNPTTGAKLAVIYPYLDELWRHMPRFLQLYTDGGNYWYTGAGKASSFGRDFVVCLYADPSADSARLDGLVPRLLDDVREAARTGEVKVSIKPLPGPSDGPLYLMNYDHAVGFPKIQEEARTSASFLKDWPELKVGLQAEGYSWDWLAKNDPAFVREARDWMATYRGRWLPGGGSYCQPYFTFISEESGVRQMLYGTRAIKEHLGYDNRIYLYSEHETMPQMPQLLSGMGYRGAFFRTHMGYGGNGPSRDADWVRWIGPDGSGIPAVPAYTGREKDLGNEWLLINYKPGINWYQGAPMTWDDMEAFRTEMLVRGVSKPIVSRCEDWYTRPSLPLLQDARANLGKDVHWVTAEDYFGLLEKSGKPAVEMRAGPNEFTPRQPWGYTGNRTWTAPRTASARAVTAEALASAAILKGFGWTPEHQKRLDEAWKSLMVAEHHDALICALFHEGSDFTDPSKKLSDAIGSEAAGHIARRIGVRGSAVFVFNSTGRPRTEAVRIADAAGVGRVVGPDRKSVPCQRDGKDLWFVARDVPALGYAAYLLRPGDLPAAPVSSPRTVVTDRLTMELGEKGGIARLTDRQTGREIVKQGSATGVLRGLINSAEATSRGAAQVTMNGPCVWRVVEAGDVGGIGYEVTYTLTAASPNVDVHIRLQIPKGTRIGSPADRGTPDSRRGGIFMDNSIKLRFVVETALNADATAVRHQPLIVTEAPSKDQTIDSNLWASLEDETGGLAIANRGSMGLRRVGAALEPILAYSGEYVWGDNFLEGTYEYDLALVPYAGAGDRATVHAEAVAFDRPLYVLPFEGQGGDLPLKGSTLKMGRLPVGVAAQALFPQDGQVFLRLCNMTPQPVRVALPPSREANLALRLGRPVSGPASLAPWRAQTYALSR